MLLEHWYRLGMYQYGIDVSVIGLGTNIHSCRYHPYIVADNIADSEFHMHCEIDRDNIAHSGSFKVTEFYRTLISLFVIQTVFMYFRRSTSMQQLPYYQFCGQNIGSGIGIGLYWPYFISYWNFS